MHVPDLDALIAGDVVYNDVHAWMSGSDHERRTSWMATLDEVERLHPKTIIAGHSDPDAPDNDGPRLLEQTRRYIHDFDESVAECGSGDEVVARMTERYPTLGNPYTLCVRRPHPAVRSTARRRPMSALDNWDQLTDRRGSSTSSRANSR